LMLWGLGIMTVAILIMLAAVVIVSVVGWHGRGRWYYRETRGEHTQPGNQKKPRWFKPGLSQWPLKTISKPTRSSA